jgi:hypothetical protein
MDIVGMSIAMKPGLIRTMAITVAACFLAAGLAGCGGGKGSARSDAADLERAFDLKPGAAPSQESTPAGVASRAVAALRARDWPRAVSLLNWVRLYASLTVDQARAVQNAYANAHLRLTEQAAKGNAEAKAALDRAKQEADRR